MQLMVKEKINSLKMLIILNLQIKYKIYQKMTLNYMNMFKEIIIKHQ